jgi:nucleotide-binding universal stress UspA family protein
MTMILAAIDDGTTAPAVLATALKVASMLPASLQAVHVRNDNESAVQAAAATASVPLRVIDGDTVNELVRAVDRPEVVLGVIGARGGPEGTGLGHVATAVVERAATPVLVVPATPRPDGSRPILRALVPLEGTDESSTAVAAALEQLAAAGVELVAVHVFDEGTVPRFWDSPAHAGDSYRAEFASRWCSRPDVDLHLRRGSAPTAVLDVADTEHADLIALGWAQNLSPGRARLVRAVLAKADVPVLLVPLAEQVNPRADRTPP